MRLIASFTLAALCLVGFNLLTIQGSDPFPTQQSQIEKESQSRDEAIAKSITDLSEQVRLLRSSTAGAEATTMQLAALRDHGLELSSVMKDEMNATSEALHGIGKAVSLMQTDTDAKIADLEARVAAIEARCKCGLPQATVQASQYPKATAGSTGSAPVSQAPVVTTQAPVIATVTPVVTPQRSVTRTVQKTVTPQVLETCWVDEFGVKHCPNEQPNQFYLNPQQPVQFDQFMRQTESTTVSRPGLLGRIRGR